MQKRSLLFLSQTLPYPPDGGVNIRTYNILRLLARQFEITALCFYRRAERPSGEMVASAREALSRLARVDVFPIPQEHSRTRLIADHALSALRRTAYTLRAYASDAFRDRLAQIVLQGGTDLVHLDSLDLAGYLHHLGDVPVVCTHHNVESRLLRRRALAERVWWRRQYLLRQAAWLRALEQHWCPRVALNVVVSEVDLEELRLIAPGASLSVVPNGVDVEAFRPTGGPQDGLVFVGGVNWFPNRDALEYFSREILPRLRAGGDHPVVRWVGRSSEGDRAYYARQHGIELTGYLSDVRPAIAGAACYVVPLRVGGGTRLKILDAWAMGKAVVSTPVGCEGLDARDGVNLLIREDPDDFAHAVRMVLRDRELRERLGRAARETAERLYGWDVIGAQVDRLYLPLARTKVAATSC